jgi:predicted double-glycine peptidase
MGSSGWLPRIEPSWQPIPFPMRKICWLFLAPALLGGCASVTRFSGITLSDDALFLSNVAPIRQNKTYACGPACVAAVAAHWGITPAEFKAKIPRSIEDVTGDDLQRMAQQLGLQAFAYQGSMEDLRQNLEKGRPVIAMIPMPMLARGGLVAGSVFNLWNELGPRPPHWVVVVGVASDNRIIINDPASGPLLVKDDRFREWWTRSDNLCVLIAGSGVPSATP